MVPELAFAPYRDRVPYGGACTWCRCLAVQKVICAHMSYHIGPGGDPAGIWQRYRQRRMCAKRSAAHARLMSSVAVLAQAGSLPQPPPFRRPPAHPAA